MGEGAAKAPQRFPGLDEIRGIAALAIVVAHVSASAGLFGLEPRPSRTVGLAGFRVWIFFALSGFLNTWFLLEERDRTGTIDLRRFHLRRALRIWPVYFLAVAAALVLAVLQVEPIPSPIPVTLASYGLLVPNLAYALGLRWWPVAQLWSVGALEQFSWFWPGMARRSRRVLQAAGIVIGVYLVVKLLAWRSGSDVAYQLVRMAGFDAMALGAAGAALAREGGRALDLTFSPLAQLAAWAFLAWGVVAGPVHVASVVDAELHALAVTILIVNLARNPRPLVPLRIPLLARVGRISYELYGFHMIVVFLIAKAAQGRLGGLGGGALALLVIQCGCVLASLLVALAAHRILTRPLAGIRARFAPVAPPG